MDNNEIKKRVEAMQAFLDGRPVECRFKDTEEGWDSCPSPSFNFEKYEYRAKPATKKLYAFEKKQTGRIIFYSFATQNGERDGYTRAEKYEQQPDQSSEYFSRIIRHGLPKEN